MKVGSLWRNKRNKRIAKVETVRLVDGISVFVDYRYESAVGNPATRRKRPHVAMQSTSADNFKSNFEEVVPW